MSDTFSEKEFDRALDSVGVARGATVMVHASLLHLGRLDGAALNAMPNALIGRLLARLGPEGTLVMLAPFYDYADKHVPFDTRHSPVSRELGVLSVAFAKFAESERSANPLFALAACGAQAAFICNQSSAAAFGTGSAWENMMTLQPMILMLGCGIERLTLVRLIEQRVGAPYLYTKLFTTPVQRDYVPLDLTVTALLRYRYVPIAYELDRLSSRLAEDGLLRQAQLGAGHIRALDAQACVSAGAKLLATDPYFFLAQPPAFVAGKLPLI